MIDLKGLLNRDASRSSSSPRGSRRKALLQRLERPLLRDFPARSDYNIILGARLSRWRDAIPTTVRIGLFLPSIFAIVYFGLFATPRYVSEAKFIVRTAAKANGSGISLTSLLQITGLSRSQDDAFSVIDFMTSRDAVAQLQQKLPLAPMYGVKEADFLARYPSFLFGATKEQFYKYFQWMLSVSYSNNSGISILRVQAFRPEDAHSVADALLGLGEQLVNKMNDRIYQDAIKVSLDQVTVNEQRLIEAQISLTNFRNRELMIDPGSSSAVISNVVQRLSTSLAETQTQLNEMKASSPFAPQIVTLQRRANALVDQIAKERGRFSGSSDGIANKTADFERLALEREFAKQTLATSNAGLETARVEGRRKQLYLERVVEPSLPDYATAPSSLRWIATIVGANLLGLLVIWLFVTGIREHAAAA